MRTPRIKSRKRVIARSDAFSKVVAALMELPRPDQRLIAYALWMLYKTEGEK